MNQILEPSSVLLPHAALPTELGHCSDTPQAPSQVGRVCQQQMPAARGSWGTRGAHQDASLPLCQTDFKPPVQHPFKPGLAAQEQYVLMPKSKGITIPEEERQLAWPEEQFLFISLERLCPGASRHP